MSDYAPSPIPTDHIVLPDELAELTEKLAENTHDQWARQRLADGWRYGDKRDDSAKTHPSLVPMTSCQRAKKPMIASQQWKR